ncbi:MAG: hypothetical protein J5509_10955 [Lachnospiraceae bacterium]|nr:hypothetical protein [Lachnospiraceae bacterium]
MAIDRRKAIKTVIEAASNYERFLNNKSFLIVYKTEKGIEYVDVVFRSWHFLHLTGLKTKLSAKQFYETCLENKLSEKDLIFDNSGKAEQKLKVLPYLHDLLYHNCMIGEFINSGVMIQADYFVGDTKLILSLGFRRESNRDVPVTLYAGDVRKLTNPTNKVLAIFVRSFSEEIYNNNSYISKDTVIEDLDLPKDLVLIPDNDNLEDSKKKT